MDSFKEHINVIKSLGQCSLKSLKLDPKDRFTCFEDHTLRMLAARNNIDHRRVSGRRELHKALLNRTKCKDGDDVCIAERSSARDDPRVSQSLKAPKPKGRSWKEFSEDHFLYTQEIWKALEHYSDFLSPKFKFLGTFPANFNVRKGTRCVAKTFMDLCDFNLSNLTKEGCSSFAVVLNTHDEGLPGEHWVALFFDVDKKSPNYGGMFYDSNGTHSVRDIPRHAHRFMETVRDQVGPDFPIRFNKVRHQKENVQCGMFAVSFIVAMVTGHHFDTYCKSSWITDDRMESLRRIFYS